MDSTKLGHRLAMIRKHRNITQGDIAKSLGISRDRISNWEQGRTTLPADILPEIAKVLDVTPDEFLGYKPQGLNGELYRAIEGMSDDAKIALLQFVRTMC